MNLRIIENLVTHTIKPKSYRWRTIIILMSLTISVSIYRYTMQYYNSDNDFVKIATNVIFPPHKAYYFYSDLSTDEISTYAKLGQAMSRAAEQDLEANITIKPRGESGALENAYGVLNHPNAFGIIQSDTYLSASFIKNRIKEITPLYMERLHILYRCSKNCNHEEPLILRRTSENSPCDANYIVEEAIKNHKISLGVSGSSASLLFPILLRHFGIGETQALKLASELAVPMQEMVAELQRSKEERRIDVAVFTVGTSHLVKDILSKNKNSDDQLSDERYHLIGVDPVEIPIINEKFHQALETTKFNSSYYDIPYSLPTVGAFALLVSSSGLSDREIAHFLSMLDNISRQADMKHIFESPPIVLNDLKTFYQSKHNKSSWNWFKALIVFLISVSVSTFLIIHLLIWMISSSKQARNYNQMMDIYRQTTGRNAAPNDSPGDTLVQLNRAHNLVNGIQELRQLGQSVREQYNEGTMTITHHEYLIQNLQYLIRRMQKRLVQRLSFQQDLFGDTTSLFRERFVQHIRHWHADSYIETEGYRFLIERFDLESNKARSQQKQSPITNSK